MEKDFRLFIKNLPLSINEAKIEELLKEYGTVKKIDLKEKTDISNKTNKFAFANLLTNERNLNTCCNKLNGSVIDNFSISVELAKESFLDRLKRERNEASNNDNNSLKKQEPTFLDTDYDLNKFPKIKNKKKKFDEEEICKIESEPPTKIIPKIKKKEIDFNSFAEFKPVIDCETEESKNVSKKEKEKALYISESEKRRKCSVKEKKNLFKAREKLIKDSLKSLDSENKTNKIYFEDYEKPDQKQKNEKQKMNLFDSDDDNINDSINESLDLEKLEAKSNLNNKLLKLQSNFGNDSRFKIDERFLDEDKDDIEQTKNEAADDIQKDDDFDEKKWQLGILENVLGKPLDTPKMDTQKPAKKFQMIRYDPTASNHEDFEIKAVQEIVEKPKKKKKKLIDTESKEEEIPTSKDIFYDVSENLFTSLQENENFSLFKSLGRENIDNNTEIKKDDSKKPEDNQFNFDFVNKKAFKYDSSDNEDEDMDENIEKQDIQPLKDFNTYVPLFFVHNDSRFEEAKHFFSKGCLKQHENFNNRRREIKQIIRKKIRNNLKKKTPWKRKSILKVKPRS